ncbi:nucleotidyltransferase [Chengkuizengella axinellae]|uniref:tRNA(Met) cytidine acetate ligase n=1 Tax=Chengkuizengella axinellae TaxID=3064388 RepID=A0ABT9IVM1_9BACL|nr:nucleotidyltransferase [Chengkuizengella sp. 2205SS18-9]MDP5273398.1 nucleotidyltransferase [Chengkuizengella sp. 2205SS18-9]
MKTVGIIVEYNPLHNGHVYHFEQSKKAANADAVVAIMSGDFLQRGEPALVNKWSRAEMALHMGADLIIELPVLFSSQPAEWFAYGAVSALDAAGVVDSLCFGSESGELNTLKTLAKKLKKEPDHFQTEVKQQLKKGMNYPTAYTSAIQKVLHIEMPDHMDLSQPNNTLGLHYLIALERLNSSIKPLTITRHKAGFHQQEVTDQLIASATAIRKLIFEEHALSQISQYVPAYTYDVLRREFQFGRGPIGWEDFQDQLLYKLLSLTPSQCAAFYEVSEGLENRLKQTLPELQSTLSVANLLHLLKTKRYTKTKLQRTLLRILLNHHKTDITLNRLKKGTPYLRVLGFSKKGQQLLKQMKKTAKVPIITKVSKSETTLLDMDIRAASIYSLSYNSTSSQDMFQDYYQPPIMK